MPHLVQVGCGSGGMPVLDAVARDPRISSITLIEPDVFKEHNVIRHLFSLADVGQLKADLARHWLRERRPDLAVDILPIELGDPTHDVTVNAAFARADLGICAADNESAKFHFNHLMLHHKKPWTLGEVLAGGIGGFVHAFVPDGPCYGCVASFLQRSVTTDLAKPPDYSQPASTIPEATIPASKAAIAVIAGLHAQLTLRFLDESPGAISLLLPLVKVPGVFEEPYRVRQLKIPRSPNCLMCGGDHEKSSEHFDADLERALESLKPTTEIL